MIFFGCFFCAVDMALLRAKFIDLSQPCPSQFIPPQVFLKHKFVCIITVDETFTCDTMNSVSPRQLWSDDAIVFCMDMTFTVDCASNIKNQSVNPSKQRLLELLSWKGGDRIFDPSTDLHWASFDQSRERRWRVCRNINSEEPRKSHWPSLDHGSSSHWLLSVVYNFVRCTNNQDIQKTTTTNQTFKYVYLIHYKNISNHKGDYSIAGLCFIVATREPKLKVCSNSSLWQLGLLSFVNALWTFIFWRTTTNDTYLSSSSSSSYYYTSYESLFFN